MPINDTTARIPGKANAARRATPAQRALMLDEVLAGGLLMVLQHIKDENGGQFHAKDEMQQLEDELQQIVEDMHNSPGG